MLPAELVASPTRRFGVVDTERCGLRAKVEGEERCEYPSTLAAVETFASDASGMLVAEGLGRELARRLVPWGSAEISVIEWFCLTHERPMPFDLGYAYDVAYNSLEYALEEEGIVLDELSPDESGLPEAVNWTVRAHFGWSLAIERELEVPAAYWPPPTVKWQPFAAFENPFEVALALLETGYLPSAIDADKGVLRLHTFCIDAPPAIRPGRRRSP
ncbi:MAG: hypothetical protein Tsb0020_44430 [Haliangiales bacterium]